jgi:hypothetical protein
MFLDRYIWIPKPRAMVWARIFIWTFLSFLTAYPVQLYPLEALALMRTFSAVLYGSRHSVSANTANLLPEKENNAYRLGGGRSMPDNIRL